MNKIESYKKAQQDCIEAYDIAKGYQDKINAFENVAISNVLVIDRGASTKQILYGLGVLKSQIIISKEIGHDCSVTEQQYNSIVELYNNKKEYTLWTDYHYELVKYKDNVEQILSADEKFQLLEYPEKPKA